MLVLTRRAGESIVIGNDVVITVLEVRGGQIRIGIDAPRDLSVHRAEIYLEVQAENQAAVASTNRSSALLRTKTSSLKIQPRPAGDPSDR